MAESWLMFNDAKTKFIIQNSRFCPSVNFTSLHIGDELISLSDTAHNLEFISDSGMNFTKELNTLVKIS